MQAWGENIKAATQAFAAELAQRHAQGNTQVAADSPVYFDLFGRYLVSPASCRRCLLCLCSLPAAKCATLEAAANELSAVGS